MICCVTLTGDLLKPMFVAARPISMEHLGTLGLRVGSDADVQQNESYYVSKDIFLIWVRTILLPEISNRRKIFNLPHQTAVLLMDNLSAHITDAVEKELGEANVCIITSPPHSTHLLQALDLGIFSAWKSHIQAMLEGSTHDPIERLIYIAFNAIRKAAVPLTIKNAFRRAGMAVNYFVSPHSMILCEDSWKTAIDTARRDRQLVPKAVRRIGRARGGTHWGMMNLKYLPQRLGPVEADASICSE